jgi:hypothetical protein
MNGPENYLLDIQNEQYVTEIAGHSEVHSIQLSLEKTQKNYYFILRVLIIATT